MRSKLQLMNRRVGPVVALMISSVSGTSIKMDFLPIGDARIDPIISQDCLSDHVHTFYGPAVPGVVRPEVTYQNLIDTTPEQNTGNLAENKSLYWHPTVYSYDKSTDTYTRDEIAQTSAYYIWENGVGTEAFPNGFKMIAGLDPDNPKNFPNAIAECVGPSPCEKDDCDTESTFFPKKACAELEVSMSMPTCWDGRLDSPDHVSHVHYTLDGSFDGECPDSHPRRLPQIQLFFRIMPYDGGWHTFSDLSDVYHSDYISGWDETFLQKVLDECETDSFAANPNSFCEDFVTFRDAPKCTNEETCDFADPALLQKLKNIQPPKIDLTKTVSPEETQVVKGKLPEGTCNGELLPFTQQSCTNVIGKFKIPNGKKKRCSWLDKKSKRQIRKKCKQPLQVTYKRKLKSIANVCKETCGKLGFGKCSHLKG